MTIGKSTEIDPSYIAAKNKTGRFDLTTFTPNSTVFSANDWHNSEDSTKRGHTEFPMMFDRLIGRKTVRGTESTAIMFLFPPLSNFPLSSSSKKKKKKRKHKSRAILYNTNMLFHPVEIERSRHTNAWKKLVEIYQNSASRYESRYLARF